jgi:hypothetical protein
MQGKSNKAISRVLDLAEPTVKIHVSAILKALKGANRTEAVIAATALGLGMRQDARSTTWPVLVARILNPRRRGEMVYALRDSSRAGSTLCAMSSATPAFAGDGVRRRSPRGAALARCRR